MKTTKRLMLMLLVVAGMVSFTSCRKVFNILPETVTVSGQVTDENGQPFEGVGVSVSKSTFMSLIIPVTGTKTDENGFYQVEFEPDDETFTMRYEIDKDGHHYQAHYGVDKWKAVQEHDVVLKKTE
jgi:hypothetical protein